MSNPPNSGFNVRFPAKQPAKKSIFERQRAEAEAKRQREAAETAAVYEDFVKSFDDGDSSSTSTTTPSKSHHLQHQQSFSIPQPKSGPTVGVAGGRRHFSIPSSGHGGRNSGPGSLGGSGFNNSNNNRNTDRPRDGRPSRLSDVRTRLAFGDDDEDEDGGERTKGESDEEGQIVEDDGPRNIGVGAVDRAEEKATSKPTIRLANMPPGTSPAAVKALVVGSSKLTVDAVRILPSSNPSSASTTDRKSVTAIVTLAAETAASDIDAAVSAMQNRYMGYGYYLNLHRHLSSAVVAASSSTPSTGNSAAASQPFGARPVPPQPKTDNAPPGFAPPISFQGGPVGRSNFQGRGMGIPPPSTYTSANLPNREGILHVPVRAPRDIKKLRMIHKVIENVLDQGPEFEALLMSRPEVQLEEKWAWLWDARCEAGVWYRYRLWETVTGLYTHREKGQSHGQKKGGKYVPVFEGSHAWKTPDNPLPFEFDTSLGDLLSDSEYNSSDDSDEETAAPPPPTGDDDKETFLNPLEKARLTHLLARLPITLSKLRKGDVARVTAFAITHASRGANEIVDLIVANVERPFSYTSANPDYAKEKEQAENSGADAAATSAGTGVDTSGAQLIAVYVVSDILSSSATSGIRHAWRFRQLFDAALRRRNVFASLGRLADKFRWGRMRAEKWKRSIGLVLGHWEGWSVFSAETQAFLVSSFENPPLLPGEKPKETEEAGETTGMAGSAKKSRWKTVDTTVSTDQASSTGFRLVDSADDKMQVDGEPGGTEQKDADADDEWAYRSDYTDDEALDLACMDDEDIDGEPLEGVGARLDFDGIPLTADEVRALVGDMDDEMSEEGEIASDEDEQEDDYDYEAYGMSSTDGESDHETRRDHDRDDRDGRGHNRVNDVRGVQGGQAQPDAQRVLGEKDSHQRDVAMQDAHEHGAHEHDAPQPTAGYSSTKTTTVNTTSETEQGHSQDDRARKEPAHAKTMHSQTAARPNDPPFMSRSTETTTAPTGISASSSAPSGSSAVQASSVQTPQEGVSASTDTPPGPAPFRMKLSSSSSSSAFPPRKRMRAADMFNDEDEEGEGEGENRR